MNGRWDLSEFRICKDACAYSVMDYASKKNK
jgi:hypothetical protein